MKENKLQSPFHMSVMDKTLLDFWRDVYNSSIRSGANSNTANNDADRGVQDLIRYGEVVDEK